MHYFLVPAAKETLFSTGILLVNFSKFSRFLPKAVFFPADFVKFRHFQENEFVIFLVFQDTWEPWLFVKLHSYRLAISLIFICTSSKLKKASSTFNPNITTTYTRPPYLSRSNSKQGLIVACWLSARTYNTEVQGSNALICNHFVYVIIVLNLLGKMHKWQSSLLCNCSEIQAVIIQSLLIDYFNHFWSIGYLGLTNLFSLNM